MIKWKVLWGSAITGFKSQETLTSRAPFPHYKNVSIHPEGLLGTKRDKVFERTWSLVGYLLVGSISFPPTETSVQVPCPSNISLKSTVCPHELP